MDYDAIDHPESANEVPAYANVWVRFGALIIDEIVWIAIRILFFILLFHEQLLKDWHSFQSIIYTKEFGYFSYTFVALRALYFIAMESSAKQATLGKMAVGIIVGNENGERISPINSFGRFLSKEFFMLLLLAPVLSNMLVLFCFLYVAGFLLAIWDQQKQALHDKIASTYVFVKK